MIAGQAILDFFTGGLFEAVPILEEILEAPAEMMEEVFGLLKELGTYVVDGVKEIGSMVSEAGGALGEMMGSLSEIGEDLIKFGEELLEDLGLVSKEAAAGEAAVSEAGAAAGAVETGAAEMSAAEKAAAEAQAAEEAAAAEAKAAQEAEEAEKQAANEAEEKAEQKEAEKAEAEAEAEAITHAEDAAHVPLPVALAALDELKAQFDWIDHFEAEAAGPGVSELFLVASPKTLVGTIHEARPAEEEATEKPNPSGMTKDEFVARYKELNPTTKYSEEELEAIYDQNRYVINERTGLLNDTEAGKYGLPENRAQYVETEAGETAVQEIEQEAVPAEIAKETEVAAAQRQQSLEAARAAEEAGDEAAANAARQQAREASEELGKQAGLAYGEDLKAQGYDRVMTGEGARTFDQVYVRPPDEVVILETKGGTSGLGTRFGEGSARVEQGTSEYIGAVTGDLEKTNAALADQIRAALEDGKLRYLEVRQPFTAEGALEAIEVKEFAL